MSYVFIVDGMAIGKQVVHRRRRLEGTQNQIKSNNTGVGRQRKLDHINKISMIGRKLLLVLG